MDTPDTGLSSQIPHLEFQVLARDCFNIEANRCVKEQSMSTVSAENMKSLFDQCYTVIV